MAFQLVVLTTILLAIQNSIFSLSNPIDLCGGCAGGWGGNWGPGCGCPPPPPPPCSPPIAFQPVPQPVPIRIPSPKPQSVTIPNIILALLPPNNKPTCQPIPRPQPPKPLVLPIPQPFPIAVNECGQPLGGCGIPCC